VKLHFTIRTIAVALAAAMTAGSAAYSQVHPPITPLSYVAVALAALTAGVGVLLHDTSAQ
jgi:hypothetical protein